MRPLGRVYGRSNLYRDMTDLSDVDHREANLLDWKILLNIFTPLSFLVLSTARKELGLLRKYRNAIVSHTYLQEENCHLAVSRKGIV